MARPDCRHAGRRPAASAVALAVVLTLAAAGARAQEFNYDLKAGMGHSDNIKRTQTDTIDEWILGLGLGFDYAYQSGRIDAAAFSDLVWYDYLENTYDSNVIGNFDGNFLYTIVPERLTWAFTDNFGQAQTDPFQPVTPDNSENINVFSTGPDFLFSVGPRYQARVFGRWSDLYYQTNPYGGQRWLGGLSFERALSEQSTLSLNGTYAKMNYYDQPSQYDFDVQEYYAGYKSTSARTSVLVNLGYRTLTRDGSTTDGPLVRLNLSRKLSGYSTLGLLASSEYGDAGTFLSTEGRPPGGGQGPLYANRDIAVRNNVEGTWRIDRQRTNLWFSAGYEQLNYEVNDAQDQNWVSLHANASRKLNEALTLGAGVYWRDYTFPNASGQDYNQLDLRADLNWKPARAFYVNLEVEYNTRDSDNPTGGYDETRFFLWLGYAPERD
jgi:hypothetical protein